MVKSIQSTELGDKWFGQLQKEVESASETGHLEFRAALDPDLMGPDGKEGIDADS